MNLSLVYWDNPILSTVAEPVKPGEFGVEMQALGGAMLDLIRGKGIGLAATQVGVSKRLFVMTRQNVSLPDIIAVNPKIKQFGDLIPHQEGCLSLPSIFEQVVRPRLAVLEYQHPLTGEMHTEHLSDLDAFCAAHENDHLDGIMFFDRRRMVKNLSKSVERKWDKVKDNFVKG